MKVAEIRMLRWMCGFTRRDRIKDEDIQNKVEVTLVEEKMWKVRLRLLGHVMKRCTDAKGGGKVEVDRRSIGHGIIAAYQGHALR
ncbi:hypothetical protein H5410_051641 [Solanum commersonii]|uniref:Uncharacterized protein n=1 Tax=Solanum commersonii TaxID=4109 RepID=A0A9J5X1B8_SOLCO|nr:hypothetical protein H5410_051641 [Solanum commersonii]